MSGLQLVIKSVYWPVIVHWYCVMSSFYRRFKELRGCSVFDLKEAGAFKRCTFIYNSDANTAVWLHLLLLQLQSWTRSNRIIEKLKFFSFEEWKSKSLIAKVTLTTKSKVLPNNTKKIFLYKEDSSSNF